MEADELWSFVGNKGTQAWVWAALDLVSRQIVAMVVGDRSQTTAQALWDALPPDDQADALVCTDFWAAYAAAVPDDRHNPGGKEAGITCHIERFWCTLRPRCGRFVRRTLSFSKCPKNHVGALWYFVRDYNSSLL